MADLRLTTERLIIRNWEDQDKSLFHLINSNETVMEFFPFRRDRSFTDRIMEEVQEQISKNGYGHMAVALRHTNKAIGFCALADVSIGDGILQGEKEVAWRLSPEFWGNGYITEAAHCLLAYGFETLNLETIYSFAVPMNRRSIAVMKRLGMERASALDYESPRVPDTHPHLKKHIVYKIENPIKKGA